MDALVLIDLQNDFMPFGALPVADGDAVVAIANRLAATAPLVVATQDWHPLNHGSFAANHPGHRPGDVIELNLFSRHCGRRTACRTHRVRVSIPGSTSRP